MNIQMGKGNIAIMFASNREDRKNNGIAFVQREAEYPIAVDVDCNVTDQEIADGTLGYIMFSNPRSIDAVITQLQRLKESIPNPPMAWYELEDIAP